MENYVAYVSISKQFHFEMLTIDLTHWVPVGTSHSDELTRDDWEDSAWLWLEAQPNLRGWQVSSVTPADYIPTDEEMGLYV